MIGLGVWQLQRAKWKEGLLARYAAAEKLPPITFPTVPLRERPTAAVSPRDRRMPADHRPSRDRRRESGGRARLCPYRRLLDRRGRSGHERRGGLVEEPERKVNWTGGPVSGIIVPDRQTACGWSRLGRRQGSSRASCQRASIERDDASRSPLLCRDRGSDSRWSRWSSMGWRCASG